MNDELQAKIGAAVKDKTVAQIVDVITGSPASEYITDPLAFAALLKSWNPGGY